jgi:hypothetical protein
MQNLRPPNLPIAGVAYPAYLFAGLYAANSMAIVNAVVPLGSRAGLNAD